MTTPSYQKWEYKVISFGSFKSYQEMMDKLNNWGQEGWELIDCGGGSAIFKRPIWGD